MFKLFKLNDDKFLIRKDNGITVEGNTVQTLKSLLLMGVEETEIVLGIKSLNENSHDMADYGINLTFIYSKVLTE